MVPLKWRRLIFVLVAVSVGFVAAWNYLGSGTGSRHVLLLSTDSVSPHSVVCNGYLVNDGVALTASHCLAGTDAIAIGGSSSYCTTDGWDVVTDIEVADKGDELGQVTWNKEETPVIEPVQTQAGPVEIIGYGRNNGDGGLQCERQTLSSFEYDNRPCEERPEWESGLALCLTSDSERICPGWSGSAVMQDGELVGIVSGGSTCSRPTETGVLVARAIVSSD